MFDDESCFLGGHDVTFDDLGSNDSLFNIEVGGRFIDKVQIGRFSEGKGDGDSEGFFF